MLCHLHSSTLLLPTTLSIKANKISSGDSQVQNIQVALLASGVHLYVTVSQKYGLINPLFRLHAICQDPLKFFY